MFFEYKKSIRLFYIISFSVLFLSTIIGSLCLTRLYGSTEDIRLFIENYTNSIKDGMDMWGIVKSSVLSYSILAVIVFISSYFHIGYLVSLFMCARKGFVDGFTLSAMFSIYRFKGMHLYVPYIPQVFITIPLICFFIAISSVFSINRKDMDKKSKIIYIIFSTTVFTIFCICSIFEGFLTTTFAKWLSIKVT